VALLEAEEAQKARGAAMNGAVNEAVNEAAAARNAYFARSFDARLLRA
jgi:hypothetical protein